MKTPAILLAGFGLLLAGLPLPAQTTGTLVLPPGFDAQTPAESWSSVPFGSSSPYRVQYTYWSPCFRGTNRALLIRGLSLRTRPGQTYNHKFMIPMALYLSSATAGFNRTSTTFSKNHGWNMVLAFHGRIDLPAQTPTTAGTFNITVPFQMPFLYQTEDPGLVVELEVRAQPAGSYDLDLASANRADHQPFGGNTLCLASQTRKPLGLKGTWATLAGGLVRVVVENGPPSTPITTWPLLAFLGLSRSGSWLGTPLPVDLIKYGAPSCLLLTGPLLIRTGATDKNGGASFTFSLPSDYDLVGQTLYTQVLMQDTFANQLGVVLSNGVASRVTGPYPVGRLYHPSVTSKVGSFQLGMAPVIRLETP